MSQRDRVENWVIGGLGVVLAMWLRYHLLPKMHERYFFAADVITIVYGFYFPRYNFSNSFANFVTFR